MKLLGPAIVFALRVGGGLSVVGLQLLMARLVSRDEFGEFAFVFSMTLVASIFASWALEASGLRFVSAYRTADNREPLQRFRRHSWQLVLTAGIGVMLIFGAVATGAVAIGWSHVPVVVWWLVAAAMPGIGICMMLSGWLRANEELIPSLLAPVLRPLLAGLALLIATAGGMTCTLELAFALYLISSLVVTVGLFVYERRSYGRLVHQAGSQDVEIHTPVYWFQTSTGLMVNALLAWLQGRCGVLLAGMLLSDRDAALYAVAERCADVALLGLVSVNQYSAPQYALLHATGRREEIQRLVTTSARQATVFMLLAGGMFVVLGPWLLTLFGREYLPAYGITLTMLIGSIFNAGFGSVGVIVQMTGRQNISNRLLFFTGLFNVSLAVALTPWLGVYAIAISSVSAVTLWKGLMAWAVHHQLGIRSDVLTRNHAPPARETEVLTYTPARAA